MTCHLIQHRVSDGTQLAVGVYPAGGEGPVVLLLHGIVSHMGWYRGVARMLQEREITTYLPDRRGIARSQGTQGHVARWDVLVEDVVQLAQEIEQRHPRRPLHALGISLGGAIATACAIHHPGLFRSLLLLSPALASALRMPLWRKLKLLSRALLRPKSLVDIPFGVEQLTGSETWRKALGDDPRRTRKVSARFLLEVLRMQRYIRGHIHHLSEPVLALFGALDQIVDSEGSIRVLRKMRATVRVEVFEAVAHILSAALPARRLADRLVDWLRGDHGSASDRFTLLRTVLSREGEEEPSPPNLDETFDDASA